QYRWVQHRIFLLWQTRACQLPGPESPNWPRTAIAIRIHHPSLEDRPIAAAILAGDYCLDQLYSALQQWVADTGVRAVCPVSPQPTCDALHFVACSHSLDVVGVVLIWGGRLWARFLPRLVSELRSYHIQGTVGHVGLPCGAQGPLGTSLRDGDCLPFWPGPEIPADSSDDEVAGLTAGSTRPALAARDRTAHGGLLTAISGAFLAGRSFALLASLLLGPALGTSAVAMQVPGQDRILHMSCHAHGDVRRLPPCDGPGPIGFIDLVEGPPRQILHLVWFQDLPVVSLRTCSCTSRAILEGALLADVEDPQVRLRLDASPPALPAVHWRLTRMPHSEFPPTRSAALTSTGTWGLRLGLLIANLDGHAGRRGLLSVLSLIVLGHAMLQTDQVLVPEPYEGPIISAFPWQLSNAERTFASLSPVGAPVLTRLLSPFRGALGIRVTEVECTWSEFVQRTLAEDIPWASQLTPVWPAIESPALSLVPVPPDPRLACVVISSEEWDVSMCLPSPVPSHWLLEAVRHQSPGMFGQLFLQW
ncbi:unnamed protein product, partial [Symbiodinium natans]